MGKNVIILDVNNLSHVASITEAYLKEILDFQIETKDFQLSKSDKAVVSNFNSSLNALNAEHRKKVQLAEKHSKRKNEFEEIVSDIKLMNQTYSDNYQNEIEL